MLQRTEKLFIGKDISRDAHLCVDGAALPAFTKTTGIANGEILVLDKNKKILASGATKLDTDVIYICEGTSETYSYTDPAGTTVSSVRRVIVSDPIEGNKVKKYSGKSYTVNAQRTAAFTYTGYTPVANTEYIIRIVYKDMVEHPGQFTQTYRIIATAAQATNVQSLVEALVAKINSHKGRRVVASEDNATITLTGLEKPECTTGLTDLDEFSMVDFDAYFLYVDSSSNWQVIGATSKVVTYTGPTFGSGNWEQIRDIERACLGYIGVTTRNQYGFPEPAFRTVVDATYDLIVIDHDRSYLSPDNQYVKQAPLKTLIAFVVPTTGDQEQNVLERLNSWMESFGFDSVTV